jgi:hypothetical protein
LSCRGAEGWAYPGAKDSTVRARTKGRWDGKLPVGNDALRSPAFSLSAAMRAPHLSRARQGRQTLMARGWDSGARPQGRTPRAQVEGFFHCRARTQVKESWPSFRGTAIERIYGGGPDPFCHVRSIFRDEPIVFKPYPNGIEPPDNVFKRRHNVAGLKHNVFRPVNNDARLKYNVFAPIHIVSRLKYIVFTVKNNGLRSSNNGVTPFHGSGRGKFRPCGRQTLHPLSHLPRRDLVSLRGRLKQEESGRCARWMSCLTNPRRIPAARPPIRGAASGSGSDGVPECSSPRPTPRG